MAQGMTIKGSTADGHSVTFRVDADGQIYIANSSSTPAIGMTKFDPSDAQPTYIGTNTDVDASDGATDWVVYKYTYNGSNQTTQIQRKVGSWTGRALLF